MEKLLSQAKSNETWLEAHDGTSKESDSDDNSDNNIGGIAQLANTKGEATGLASGMSS